MGRLTFGTICALLLLATQVSGLPGAAPSPYRVLLVQSFRVGPYEAVVEGFQSACTCRVDRFILSQRKGEGVMDAIRRGRPHAVLAIGQEALARVGDVRDLPVFYTMVLDPSPDGRPPPDNRFGVRMTVSSRAQLSALSSLLPAVREVGVLYDPDRTGDFALEARRAFRERGMTLVEASVSDASQVVEGLEGMLHEIRAFWMLPDLSVVTAETARHILLTCLTHGVPVIAFSEKYLDMGAFMAITFDPYDVGVQAGEMASAVLRGEAIPEAKRHRFARTPLVKVNRKIARKLGIEIDAGALERIDGKPGGAE
jgi:putative ABC transport system substrate-binding protein